MGDRTNCILEIYGKIPRKIVPPLVEMIKDCDPAYGDFDITKPIEFDDVNYAQIPGEIVSVLALHNLSWVWSWAPGGEYPGGIEMKDAPADRFAEFSTIDGEIALTLNQIENLHDAKRWNQWLGNQKLEIT